jgi:hypothetical protein
MAIIEALVGHKIRSIPDDQLWNMNLLDDDSNARQKCVYCNMHMQLNDLI